MFPTLSDYEILSFLFLSCGFWSDFLNLNGDLIASKFYSICAAINFSVSYLIHCPSGSGSLNEIVNFGSLNEIYNMFKF